VRVFDRHWLMQGVAAQMWRVARRGRYNGLATRANAAWLNRCKGLHQSTGTIILFSWDEGMHSFGWWKNPEYERCWHLSLSFRDPISGDEAPKNARLTEQWIEAFYGENRRYVWAESPFSDDGKNLGVWHYRVFCNPAWQPFVPRGEVYSRELTEAGWFSFSDLQTAHAAALAELAPLPGEQ
jgi:hypothetical protein